MEDCVASVKYNHFQSKERRCYLNKTLIFIRVKHLKSITVKINLAYEEKYCASGNNTG